MMDTEYDAYYELAEYIVIQAVSDYRDSLRTLSLSPDCINAAEEKRSCESFFLSEWFSQLTTIDPEWLIENLKKELTA